MHKNYGAKLTNPKDAIGSSKLPLDLVPDSLVCHAAVAFLEGALKYGKFNWRIAGVRASIYIAAMRRHIAKFTNGEWSDPKTGVPHLASVIACCGIILDANECGMLNDDRPPRHPTADMIDAMMDQVTALREQFKDCNPHQNTIEDSVWEPENNQTRITSDTTPLRRLRNSEQREIKPGETQKSGGR